MYAEFDKRTGIIKIVESVRDLTKKSGHTTILIEKLLEPKQINPV